MKVCPICKREADKLNVHLIPWFLIKNCITKEGSGLRDMEISFTIDPNNLTKLYTGRSILPETLDTFKEFKEMQREKDNPYSRDNLICTECEDKLSRLEAIFAMQFTSKKLASAFNGNTPSVGNNPVVVVNYDLSLYELMIQSIFYRCSIGRFNLLKLDKKVEKKIEENLRIAFAKEGFKKIKPNEPIEFPHRFPIITTAFYPSEKEDLTRYFITVNTSRFPYFIMAGRWMIRLYESEKHLKSSTEWLYGLNDKFSAVEAYKIIMKVPHTIVLEEKNGNTIYSNILYSFSKKKIDGIKRNIVNFHQRIFNHRPNQNVANYILQQYIAHYSKTNDETDSMVKAFYDFIKLF